MATTRITELMRTEEYLEEVRTLELLYPEGGYAWNVFEEYLHVVNETNQFTVGGDYSTVTVEADIKGFLGITEGSHDVVLAKLGGYTPKVFLEGFNNTFLSTGGTGFLRTTATVSNEIVSDSWVGTLSGDGDYKLEAHITSVEFLDWENVERSELSTVFLADGYVNGHNNTIESEILFEGFELDGDENVLNVIGANGASISVEGGYGNRVTTKSGDGAVVTVEDDASSTWLALGDGDTIVFNEGSGTKAKLGDGDDTFVDESNSPSWNPTMVTGGDGYDEYDKRGDGDAIVGEIEFLDIKSTNGNTTSLDTPDWGYVQFGQSGANLYDLMSVFGENDNGNAVLNFNDTGSVTIIGGAADYGLAGISDGMSM